MSEGNLVTRSIRYLAGPPTEVPPRCHKNLLDAGDAQNAQDQLRGQGPQPASTAYDTPASAWGSLRPVHREAAGTVRLESRARSYLRRLISPSTCCVLGAALLERLHELDQRLVRFRRHLALLDQLAANRTRLASPPLRPPPSAEEPRPGGEPDTRARPGGGPDTRTGPILHANRPRVELPKESYLFLNLHFHPPAALLQPARASMHQLAPS